MTECQFKPGEEVQSKTGTQKMIFMRVDDENPDYGICVWTDDNNNLQEESFPLVLLKKYQSRGPVVV
ncbi:MAG: hypothetical protein M9932_02000 [Xanthobacteraceae bacterium]|nr:hypothetical protein [Xanthobacteraceae bacterium]